MVGERRPERSRQVEIGARQSWRGGRVRATTSLYQLERENIAIPDDNGFTQQAGDQRARGVELELAAQPRPGLAVVASYAYTDSELTRFAELVQAGPPTFAVLVLDRSGNRSAFAPEHLARAWVSQRFGGGLRLGAGLRYVGERFTAEDNLVELDDVLLLRRRRRLRPRRLGCLARPRQPHRRGVRDARLRLELGDPGGPLRRAPALGAPVLMLPQTRTATTCSSSVAARRAPPPPRWWRSRAIASCSPSAAPSRSSRSASR